MRQILTGRPQQQRLLPRQRTTTPTEEPRTDAPPAEQPPVDQPRADRVLMVCSSGGHLAHLMALQPWWQSRQVTWVTFATAETTALLADLPVFHAHRPTTRSLRNLVRNSWLSVRVLLRVHPDVVVTTGAGVALPFFVLAHAMHIPTVYLEVVDRVDRAPLTTRLCRPFTTRILVQWEEQRQLYPEAVVVGRLM